MNNNKIVYKFGFYSVVQNDIIIANYREEFTALNHLETLNKKVIKEAILNVNW